MVFAVIDFTHGCVVTLGPFPFLYDWLTYATALLMRLPYFSNYTSYDSHGTSCIMYTSFYASYHARNWTVTLTVQTSTMNSGIRSELTVTSKEPQ